MKSNALFVAGLCCAPLLAPSAASALPLSGLLAFGAAAGDTALAPSDDGYFLINNPAASPVWSFFGHAYNSFYIDENGAVSFSAGVSSYVPQPFPASPNPMIAPFWADVTTDPSAQHGSGTGTVYERVEKNTAGSADTSAIEAVTNEFLGSSSFVPVLSAVITWDAVGGYGLSHSLVNTFQLVLTTDGTQTYAIFNYLDNGINWLSGTASNGVDPNVGFDAGDGVHYYNAPGSFTAAVKNLPTETNLVGGAPGQFAFRIDQNTIATSPTNAPEPASLTLFGLGLGAIGVARRRKK